MKPVQAGRDVPTPGQIAYAAYCLAMQAHPHPLLPPFAWEALGPFAHDAWEAAAQAVLAQAGLLVLDLDPEERRDA